VTGERKNPKRGAGPRRRDRTRPRHTGAGQARGRVAGATRPDQAHLRQPSRGIGQPCTRGGTA
jgi:hypothetical protein